MFKYSIIITSFLFFSCSSTKKYSNREDFYNKISSEKNLISEEIQVDKNVYEKLTFIGAYREIDTNYYFVTIIVRIATANGFKGRSLLVMIDSSNFSNNVVYDFIMPENLPVSVINNKIKFINKGIEEIEDIQFLPELYCVEYKNECYEKD